MINIRSKEEVLEVHSAFYPKGSGPLVKMKIVCELLEQIADKEGYSQELKSPRLSTPTVEGLASEAIQ